MGEEAQEDEAVTALMTGPRRRATSTSPLRRWPKQERRRLRGARATVKLRRYVRSRRVWEH
jgi:hypothetical protein